MIFPDVEYKVFEDYNQITNLFESIDNYSIHIGANHLSSDLLQTNEKEIIHFSNEFKSYAYDKYWRKWKNKGDYIEFEDKAISKMENLKPFEKGYVVIENGKCEIFSGSRGIIWEYHSK
jgi:hypothetical protein